MRTVTCINDTCPENGVEEHLCGDPEEVFCGVCRQPCALSELYDDPASCNLTLGSNPEP
jgi:hypothetical protein